MIKRLRILKHFRNISVLFLFVLKNFREIITYFITFVKGLTNRVGYAKLFGVVDETQLEKLKCYEQ